MSAGLSNSNHCVHSTLLSILQEPQVSVVITMTSVSAAVYQAGAPSLNKMAGIEVTPVLFYVGTVTENAMTCTVLHKVIF